MLNVLAESSKRTNGVPKRSQRCNMISIMQCPSHPHATVVINGRKGAKCASKLWWFVRTACGARNGYVKLRMWLPCGCVRWSRAIAIMLSAFDSWLVLQIFHQQVCYSRFFCTQSDRMLIRSMHTLLSQTFHIVCLSCVESFKQLSADHIRKLWYNAVFDVCVLFWLATYDDMRAEFKVFRRRIRLDFPHMRCSSNAYGVTSAPDDIINQSYLS